MPTLWQILMKKINPDPIKSSVVNNPLKAKIGSSVQFDVLDYREMTFFVREIRNVKRVINNQDFPFVDYILLARPLGQDDVLVKLRLMPETASGDLTHNVIMLQKYDELPFNEEFLKLLNDNEFVTSFEGQETGRYWRINDVKGKYYSVLTIVNESNEKTDASLVKEEIEYWDYWREFQGEANQKVREYFFVEMEKETGYFTLWKGVEIDTKRVDVR